MATIAAAAIVAGGAAYGANQAGKSADSQQASIQDQIDEARRIRKENRGLIDDSFNQINAQLDQQPTLLDLMDQGSEISSRTTADRMRTVLGDTEAGLRSAQSLNTRLANYDFSGINQSMRDVIQSNLFDIGSITRDGPGGAFANLSAQNMNAFAQQGLTNTIGIGSFISQISGVDQTNPYRVAQDLYQIENARTGTRIQNIGNRANALTDSNNQWFTQYANLSSAGMAVEAQRANANIAAMNTATSAVSTAIGSIPETLAAKAQANYYNKLSANMG